MLAVSFYPFSGLCKSDNDGIEYWLLWVHVSVLTVVCHDGLTVFFPVNACIAIWLLACGGFVAELFRVGE